MKKSHLYIAIFLIIAMFAVVIKLYLENTHLKTAIEKQEKDLREFKARAATLELQTKSLKSEKDTIEKSQKTTEVKLLEEMTAKSLRPIKTDLSRKISEMIYANPKSKVKNILAKADTLLKQYGIPYQLAAVKDASQTIAGNLFVNTLERVTLAAGTIEEDLCEQALFSANVIAFQNDVVVMPYQGRQYHLKALPDMARIIDAKSKVVLAKIPVPTENFVPGTIDEKGTYVVYHLPLTFEAESWWKKNFPDRAKETPYLALKISSKGFQFSVDAKDLAKNASFYKTLTELKDVNSLKVDANQRYIVILPEPCT